jgi:hypothetical protein
MDAPLIDPACKGTAALRLQAHLEDSLASVTLRSRFDAMKLESWTGGRQNGRAGALRAKMPELLEARLSDAYISTEDGQHPNLAVVRL